MVKRFGWVMVVLITASLMLTACGTESRDAGEDYVNALLKGDNEKALGLACESFKAGTETLLAAYAAQGIDEDSIDLKLDIGKGGNQKEIIVTGSYEYGDETRPLEYELSEKLDSRIVLDMEEQDGDWCVTEDSEFGALLDAAANPES